MENNHLDEPQGSGESSGQRDHITPPHLQEPDDNIGNREQPPQRYGGYDNQPYRRNNDGRRDANQRQGGGRPYPPKPGGGNYQRRDGQQSGYNRGPGGGNYQRHDGQQGGYGQHDARGKNVRDSGHAPRGGDRGGKRTDPHHNNRRTGTPPRPVMLIKALHRLDFASPKIALQAIQSGMIAVNGEAVINPNAMVNRQRDKVSAYGSELRVKQGNIYVVMNKLRSIAGSDEKSGATIYQNFYHDHRWFFPVGRLDKTAGGIVLLTTDRRHKIPGLSPIACLEKEYRCKVHRPVQPEEVAELQKFLDEILGEEAEIFAVRRNARNTLLSCTVMQASPTKLRAALKRFGLEILSFDRYRVGTFTAEELPAGAWRQLSPEEVDALNELAEFSAQRAGHGSGEQLPAERQQHDQTHSSLKDKMQTLYRQFFKS